MKIDLRQYRIVDLSKELHPGIKRGNQYVHGSETRRLELRRFIFGVDNTFMHWVDTESHIGTHVEVPSHYMKDGKDVCGLPPETFMGEGIVLNLVHKKPKEPIVPMDFEKAGVKKDDIVLLWSPYAGDDRPHISAEGAEWLSEHEIKMLGVDPSIRVEPKGQTSTHEALLRKDIPIVEGLANMGGLRQKRFFFIGLPIRISGLDSSWIRAIALEEL